MQVAKWGNSLAVRLPAGVVKALELQEGDDIEIVIDDPRRFAVRRKAAGDDARLARHQPRLGAGVRRHDRVRGEVARAAQVFQQRGAHQRFQHHFRQGRDRRGALAAGCVSNNAHFEYFQDKK